MVSDEARRQIRAILQTRCPACDATFGAPCTLSPPGAGRVVVLAAFAEDGAVSVHAERVQAAGIDVPSPGWSPQLMPHILPQLLPDDDN